MSMHLRGPLPIFGEKAHQDSRGGTTGAAADATSAGAPATSPERRGKAEGGMRLVTEDELAREREYWSDKFMQMAMDQIQVMTRKALSERDAESVQGDSGGSREGNAVLTARLSSLEGRIRAEEDQLNSVLKQINEVKAALNLVTVNLAEERRERQDTTQLAEMAVRTTRCITDELKGGNMPSQTALTSIDEGHPLKASAGPPGPEQVWEQLAGQIQRVAEEMRTEIRKDVMGSLRAELSSETARKVASLNSRVEAKVGALETHLISEMKRFTASFEQRLAGFETFTDDARMPLDKTGQSFNSQGVDNTVGSVGSNRFARSNTFQDDWSSLDAASTSTLKDDFVADERASVDFQSIPLSLKNELKGLADAVGQIISAKPGEKTNPRAERPDGPGAAQMRQYSTAARTQSPTNRNMQRVRPSSVQPANMPALGRGEYTRDSSVEMHASRSQADRGSSEPPQAQTNFMRRNTSPTGGTTQTLQQSPFRAGTSSLDRSNFQSASCVAPNASPKMVSSDRITRTSQGSGSLKVGVGSMSTAVGPQGAGYSGGASVRPTQPTSSTIRQATPLANMRSLPNASPRAPNGPAPFPKPMPYNA